MGIILDVGVRFPHHYVVEEIVDDFLKSCAAILMFCVVCLVVKVTLDAIGLAIPP